MKKYSKINKKQIIFTFLLTFNQLLLSGYTFSNKKIDSNVFEKNNFEKQFKLLISNKSQDQPEILEEAEK